MRQVHRPILPLLLLLAVVPAVGQRNCPSITLVKSKSILDQVVAFLADQKVSIAGQAVGFIADLKESPKLAALGDAMQLASAVADYLQKQRAATPPNLELCPATAGDASRLGFSSLSILGTRPDIDQLSRNGWNSSIAELLKPYQSNSPTIPNFNSSRLTSQLGSILGSAPAAVQPGQSQAAGNRLQLPAWVNPPPVPQQASINGTVRDEYGNPISGAIVSLVASFITTAQPQWRMTFENGFYSFADVPGLYSISARVSGRNGELRSDNQVVNLSAGNPSRVDLRLLPQARNTTVEPIRPEQKSMIIDFIAAADRSETRAALDGDSSYLERFYAGEALAMAREHFASERKSATAHQLESGQVRDIRYVPISTIEVDTVEVWSQVSFDPRTGRQISTQAGKELPQTITIQQTRGGWYITNVQFRH